MTRIAVVDHGAGNLVSVRHALTRAGASPVLARTPDVLTGAAGIVVPGVGASGPAMARLRRFGMADAILEAVGRGVPYLGICLGMQLLFDRSEEDGAAGFGLIPGTVVRLRSAPRVPHIGWNGLEIRRRHPLVSGLAADPACYFVHSFAPEPADRDVVLADTEYGTRFPSIVASGSLLGVQFHPERSAEDGLVILRNFVGIASDAVAAAAPAPVPAPVAAGA